MAFFNFKLSRRIFQNRDEGNFRWPDWRELPGCQRLLLSEKYFQKSGENPAAGITRVRRRDKTGRMKIGNVEGLEGWSVPRGETAVYGTRIPSVVAPTFQKNSKHQVPKSAARCGGLFACWTSIRVNPTKSDQIGVKTNFFFCRMRDWLAQKRKIGTEIKPELNRIKPELNQIKPFSSGNSENPLQPLIDTNRRPMSIRRTGRRGGPTELGRVSARRSNLKLAVAKCCNGADTIIRVYSARLAT